MRHTDRVSMACQALLVNVLAPIHTTPGGAVWRQTIFHPFALTAKYAQGKVLLAISVGPKIDTRVYGEVDQLISTATYDKEAGEIAVFAVNRGRAVELDLSIRLAGFGSDLHLVEHSSLYDDDPHAVNSEAAPDRVVPRTGSSALDGVRLNAVLPPISWHCIRLSTRPQTSRSVDDRSL
jgi:alpha-N-arabinofuranosidase